MLGELSKDIVGGPINRRSKNQMAALLYIIAGTFVLLGLSIPGLFIALSLVADRPSPRARKAPRIARDKAFAMDAMPPFAPANEQGSRAA
jgi:hypothetical protein